MKSLAIIAIAAALVSTAPSHAKPGHNKGQHDHAMAACAPGLAKKGCLPPGQAKKRYNVGFKFNRGFKGWTPYTQIPRDVRIRHSLSPAGRYIYDGPYIYRVDPVTLAVSQVITAIVR